jgi:hypothetical protein
MIVWGGVSGGAQVADGAAYDPAADSWRVLAPAPPGVLGGGGSAAAWTGHVAVFWAGNSPDGPAAGAVYDPAADSWRALPAGPLGVREGYVSVWTGHRLLIMGGAAGDQFASPVAAAVDPATGSWRRLRALNKLTGLMPSGAVWDGMQVFVFGRLSLCPEEGSSCQKSRPIFLSYTPSTDTVREIGLKDVPVGQDQLGRLVPSAWTGTELAFTTALDPSAGPVFYDPGSKTWRVGPRAPCEPVGPAYSQTAWVDSVLVAPCGRGRLALYFATSDAWRTLGAGPSPLNSRSSSAIAWTGTQLIVWSGTLKRSGNPAPRSGAIIDLGTAMGSTG